jgi:Protein of unknown function (DUF3309)
MLLILIVLLLLLALSGLPPAGPLIPHSYGYGPSGVLFVIVIILIVLLLLGRL